MLLMWPTGLHDNHTMEMFEYYVSECRYLWLVYSQVGLLYEYSHKARNGIMIKTC